jgi:hypothetical protein
VVEACHELRPWLTGQPQSGVRVMIKDWIDLVEIHEMDWNRAKEVAGHDMRRLIREVRRLREVILACDMAEDLEKVKQLISSDRAGNNY